MYKPEYCKAIVDFFTYEEPYREVVTRRITHKDGKVEEYLGLRAYDLKFFEDFARSIRVVPNTVVEWAKMHKDFGAAYMYAKHLQLSHLAINALQKTFDNHFAVFTAKNISGWRDKVDIDLDLSDRLFDKYMEMTPEQLSQRAIELAGNRIINTTATVN